MKYFSHLNTAVEILSLYDGKIPFHYFIKEFLKLNKKYGSKDRKNISRLCYAGLRVGNAFGKWSPENKIRAGLFLCNNQQDNVTTELLDDYNEIIDKPLPEKWKVLSGSYHDFILHTNNAGNTSDSDMHGQEDTPDTIFPVSLNEFSDGLDKDEFLFSFFVQPDLFIRIRPGKKEDVIKKLEAYDITYEFLPPATARLPINTKLNEIFTSDREIVIQDYSSQLTGEMFQLLPPDTRKVWDACAASGGKSLLAWDLLQDMDLTVTDIRSSIIHNLTERFQQAGISNYDSFVIDLSGNIALPFADKQDLVIADVPCSGSGTWSRTPEQLKFFNPSAIIHYQDLQRKILRNTVPAIKPGGYLLYITCSVFKKENEDNCSFLESELKLEMVSSKLLKGYSLKADTMFAALFKR